MLRSQVAPGDIMLKLYFDSAVGDPIGAVISGMTGSNYVHGGIAGKGSVAGQSSFIYDVNGGLPHDGNEGVYGRRPVPMLKRDLMVNSNRLAPNIYRSTLDKDMITVGYHVWRCKRKDVADLVHREAPAFVVRGANERWKYNLAALALEKRSILKHVFGPGEQDEDSKLATEREVIRAGGSFVDAAVAAKRIFFCTEWIAWMYRMAVYKLAQSGAQPYGMDMTLAPQDAGPGQLAKALINSRYFSFVGEILPNYSRA
ncbi:hypothetical protein CAL26_19075 [Bordetella genomosp. 9]|uniref:Uncharacterized protein n=2 Tax=Bordetella genomosp. 9 TaxID=1416803 RepID=A0A261R4X0_9BORD|nr:hypothetical protein CAL26_19075 [Bordetella genomosp. 9]